jgi:hypothetical protein
VEQLKLTFAAITALMIVAWLASVDLLLFLGGFWAVRGLLILLTGILAIGFMAVAVLLDARPMQVEPALGGLDKFYRQHKWFGIASALMAMLHWLVEKGPGWLVDLGLIERAQRGHGSVMFNRPPTREIPDSPGGSRIAEFLDDPRQDRPHRIDGMDTLQPAHAPQLPEVTRPENPVPDGRYALHRLIHLATVSSSDAFT